MAHGAVPMIALRSRERRIDPDVALIERGRRLAAGALCSGVVHEYANLLTVVGGISQIHDLGLPWSENQRTMFQSPAERGLGLIEAFRHFLGERSCSSPIGLDLELRYLEALLKVRLRGRRTTLEIHQDPMPLLHEDASIGARVAILLATLAPLEGLRERFPSRIDFEFVPRPDARASGTLRIRFQTEGEIELSSACDELLAVASALAAQWGGELSVRSGAPGSIEVGVAFTPASTAA